VKSDDDEAKDDNDNIPLVDDKDDKDKENYTETRGEQSRFVRNSISHVRSKQSLQMMVRS
jgi:hypothetical protein